MISHPVRPFAAKRPFDAGRACDSFREISRLPAAAGQPFARFLTHFFSAAPIHLSAPLVKITGYAKVGRKPGKSSHVVGRVSTKQPVESPPPSFPTFPPPRSDRWCVLIVPHTPCVPGLASGECYMPGGWPPTPSRSTTPFATHGPARPGTALPPCRARGPLHVHGRKLMSPAIHV